MYKSIIAIFFSLMFVVTFTMPTIVLVLDSDYDVSIILDSNEEEEKEGKEGKESLKDIEIKVLQMSDKSISDFSNKTSLIVEAYSNFYSSEHKELVSPPPEHYIL